MHKKPPHKTNKNQNKTNQNKTKPQTPKAKQKNHQKRVAASNTGVMTQHPQMLW